MKMDRIKLMREVVERMESGSLTPLEGYCSLRAVAKHMTPDEQETDGQCAIEALEIITRSRI